MSFTKKEQRKTVLYIECARIYKEGVEKLNKTMQKEGFDLEGINRDYLIFSKNNSWFEI